MTYIPTICVDFDGVIHSYVSPWKHAWHIPDPPVEGAIDWLCSVGGREPEERDPWGATRDRWRFRIAVYSSRSKYPLARWCMRRYLQRHGVPAGYFYERLIVFPRTKPGALITLDDRAMCFRGTFPTPEEIGMFKPWNHAARQARKAELDRIEGLRLDHEAWKMLHSPFE